MVEENPYPKPLPVSWNVTFATDVAFRGSRDSTRDGQLLGGHEPSSEMRLNGKWSKHPNVFASTLLVELTVFEPVSANVAVCFFL